MRDVELPSSDGGGGGGAAKLLAKSVALMVLRWDNVFVALASESDDLQNLDIFVIVGGRGIINTRPWLSNQAYLY